MLYALFCCEAFTKLMAKTNSKANSGSSGIGLIPIWEVKTCGAWRMIFCKIATTFCHCRGLFSPLVQLSGPAGDCDAIEWRIDRGNL